MNVTYNLLNLDPNIRKSIQEVVDGYSIVILTILEEYHANFDSCSLFCGCKIEMMIKPITADG